MPLFCCMPSFKCPRPCCWPVELTVVPLNLLPNFAAPLLPSSFTCCMSAACFLHLMPGPSVAAHRVHSAAESRNSRQSALVCSQSLLAVPTQLPRWQPSSTARMVEQAGTILGGAPYCTRIPSLQVVPACPSCGMGLNGIQQSMTPLARTPAQIQWHLMCHASTWVHPLYLGTLNA
jgi:hypothetical protein